MFFFFFKQKTAYEMRISDWSSDVCSSDVVCHGIPGDRKMADGEIVNIDVTVVLDGWHGDSSRMYLVGDKVPVKARRLVEVTYDCLMRGIEVIRPGVRDRKSTRLNSSH